MDCLLTSNSSTTKFLTEFDKAIDRIYAIKHMLPYNRDHVDFLTFVFKNLNKDIDAYYQENVFHCKNCGELAVLNKICHSRSTSSKAIIPKCERTESSNDPEP